ncbi:hypothetical protein EMIHUDRAFT_193923 [Emiliania huxleyi CCMP1516]|uniref:L-2-hydroxyglutarate dehydrogenase, mitochondrial n=2 Tax=Emiliania huxleyi TaxID=2903 RepID=A0A0D3L0M9_EMIH1|nr:hypothetical protein EMIHUDRAFT_245616 [Emiliania huxleyi CCMP1516]XP_005793993.1 hypothetical protein EMIHUDRAFT_193923 [Emiliania huxleyi CCMP1516]EOD15778.1 hypothetical protein EMIHUDRAFT_245616 [Emiliania huxleyi CCMP1516]EOD41564.1 hypothetical protein EMIHUDRAFT_193923 [Emiliania huxleyi CCMP1516]|eukprot:XP_005768207.1 hypothetical protein EMIHUDRAFT_245616 [Emiliania huxleyi CCMP1516]
MLERVQTAVVGGGVVGLAVARALSRSGREVLLLESESLTGSGTSSRNSEVVHAGIYYTAGSLKARACVEGRRALYSFCEAYAEGELAQLDAVAEKARANGLSGSGEALVRLTSAEAARLEPEVRCVGALHSPSTGIVDSHAFMTALLADAERHGATLALGSSVVVNCAGHGAPRLAAALGGMPRSHGASSYFRSLLVRWSPATPDDPIFLDCDADAFGVLLSRAATVQTLIPAAGFTAIFADDEIDLDDDLPQVNSEHSVHRVVHSVHRVVSLALVDALIQPNNNELEPRGGERTRSQLLVLASEHARDIPWVHWPGATALLESDANAAQLGNTSAAAEGEAKAPPRTVLPWVA